jgi:hypothetical protein
MRKKQRLIKHFWTASAIMLILNNCSPQTPESLCLFGQGYIQVSGGGNDHSLVCREKKYFLSKQKKLDVFDAFVDETLLAISSLDKTKINRVIFVYNRFSNQFWKDKETIVVDHVYPLFSYKPDIYVYFDERMMIREEIEKIYPKRVKWSNYKNLSLQSFTEKINKYSYNFKLNNPSPYHYIVKFNLGSNEFDIEPKMFFSELKKYPYIPPDLYFVLVEWIAQSSQSASDAISLKIENIKKKQYFNFSKKASKIILNYNYN